MKNPAPGTTRAGHPLWNFLAGERQRQQRLLLEFVGLSGAGRWTGGGGAFDRADGLAEQ